MTSSHSPHGFIETTTLEFKAEDIIPPTKRSLAGPGPKVIKVTNEEKPSNNSMVALVNWANTDPELREAHICVLIDLSSGDHLIFLHFNPSECPRGWISEDRYLAHVEEMRKYFRK